MSDEELKQLEENILQDGIRDPLVLWGDILVDGHNRYRIAQKHGLQFNTVQKEFANRDDAIIWMIDTQCGKRNLPDYAKVKLNILKESIFERQAKERMSAGGGSGISGRQKFASPITVNGQIGKVSGVSKETVRKVKFVENKGTEDTKAKARSGEISINEAFRRTMPKPPDKKAEARAAVKAHSDFNGSLSSGTVISVSEIAEDKKNLRIMACGLFDEISKAEDAVISITARRKSEDLTSAIKSLSDKEREQSIASINYAIDSLKKLLARIKENNIG